MKKLLCIAAGFAVAAALTLAGCTTAQQANVAALAAVAQTKVEKACAIVQPTLLDLAASIPTNSGLQKLSEDNGKLCTAVVTLDASSVQDLVNSVIPQAIGLVTLLPIDASAQLTIRVALGAASIALSNWLSATTSPAPTAAGASAASTAPAAVPVGASQ